MRSIKNMFYSNLQLANVAYLIAFNVLICFVVICHSIFELNYNNDVSIHSNEGIVEEQYKIMIYVGFLIGMILLVNFACRLGIGWLLG